MKKEIAQGKSTEELMALAEELGRGYFRQGLNCAECVLRTFMDIYECNVPDDVICMATGFGGGMGHTKNTCGAITGAVLALGLVKGRRNPIGPKEEMPQRVKQLQTEIYPVFHGLVLEMQEHFGTLICREMAAQFDDFDSKPRKKNCMETVAYCAALAVKYAEG